MTHPAVFRLRQPLQSACLALATFVGALLAACGSGGGARPAPPPAPADQVERFGALELVTHFRSERGGDAAGYGWQQVAHWSLRWQGQPVVIDALGGVFGDQPQALTRINAVFVIERGAGQPDLLVNVGDANNTSNFHLVRQQGEALQVRLLCIVGGGDNGVAWAQQVSRGNGTGPAVLPAHAPWWLGPRRETLRAGGDDEGRHLRLGRRCLLDTATDAVRWLPALPDDTSLPPAGPALLSPEGRRLLLLGQVETAGGAAQAALLVAEPIALPEGVLPGSVAAHQSSRQRAAWQRLPLQRDRQRYPTLHAVDAGWVLHHFRWEAGAQGERLVERRGFVPLPHRGVVADAHAEYKVEALRESLRQPLVDFLVQRFDGRPAAGGAGESGVPVRIGPQTVTVHDAGFYIAASGKPYFPGQPEDPQVQRALVRRLGEAFDAELASGRLDRLFAGTDPAAPR